MITDRTQQDVAEAIKLRKRGMPFTDAERNTLERGMATINTINRIELKQAELKRRLDKMAYSVADVTTKVWSVGDIFKAADFDRLISNDRSLRDAFYVSAASPADILPRYTIDSFNALEKWLADIEDIASYIDDNCMECDTFWCGEY